MEVYGVVYLIWNMVNGMKYVGQTIQPLKKRMAQHKCGDLDIDKAIRKYGWENFRYGVIKSCASKEEMNYREIFYIAALKTKSPYGYNRTDGGDHSVAGVKRPPETCARIAASKMGEKNPNYGKTLSDEQKAKIAASLTGKKKNLDFNGEKNPFFGKHHTNSTRAKMSAFRRGNSPYKNLVAEMQAHQFTDSILAQFLGLSRESISRKIRDEQNFTEKDKATLVQLFNKPIEYLLQRFDE